MRCISCNVVLSDFEATRKHSETNEYIDMCNHCFGEVPIAIPVTERDDLMDNTDEEFE